MSLRASVERYRENLFESVLPFWMRHSIDHEHGGFFTCLDRDGSLYDDRKYMWLNGRQVWTLCRMYNEVEKRQDWLDAASKAVRFLRANAFDPEGRAYFSLTRDGKPVLFQRKPYGAVFLMLGFLEYSRATGDAECLNLARDLFSRVQRWIADPGLLGRPAMPGGVPMSQLADIYVNASMALELYNVTSSPDMLPVMDACLSGVMIHWHPDLCLLTESAGIGSPAWHLPEGRLVCVGSVFEIAWFLLRILEHRPDPALQARLMEAVQSALDYGWDSEFGGFYYFQDVAGKPTLQLESNMKLWWVHAEALCCLAHCWALTKEDRWLRWLERVEEYCFHRFADPQYGEWFGYLDRRGEPTHMLKGNNYKGCFHIPRALLLSIQKLTVD